MNGVLCIMYVGHVNFKFMEIFYLFYCSFDFTWYAVSCTVLKCPIYNEVPHMFIDTVTIHNLGFYQVRNHLHGFA